MSGWRVQFYGTAMLCGGYAAGQRNPTDWTGMPWWSGLIVASVLFVLAMLPVRGAGMRR